MKKLRYFFEASILHTLFFIYKILGAKYSSAVGGFISRTVGPRLAASRKAYKNLNLAMPDLPKKQQKKIIAGMWDNMGRVIAEYPHLENLSRNYTEIKGEEHLLELFKSGQAAVFFGAHLGNWEINCISLLTQYNKNIDITYRSPNNPYVAKLLDKVRTLNGRLRAFPKSAKSGRHILQSLKDKHYLGILIDQKYNEGIETKFFGHTAMTNPIFVQLCQKYKCPLIPVRNERIKGCNFRLTVYPPLKIFDDEGNNIPVEEVVNQAQLLIEGWIKERPEQWLWLHRRWKNK